MFKGAVFFLALSVAGACAAAAPAASHQLAFGMAGTPFDFARQQLEIEHLRSAQLVRDIRLRETQASVQKVMFTAVGAIGLILMAWILYRHFLTRRHRDAIRRANVVLTQTLAERDREIVRRTQTEERLREMMLAAEQANRAKSQFLANMSHELRTPLNAIIGFSDILAQGVLPPTKAVEYAADIGTGGRHLLSILNDILDMARIDAGAEKLTETEFFLSDAIEEALCLAGNAKPVHFDDVHDEIVIVGDLRRIRQIVLNLVSNAMKFIGHDARIEVRVQPVQDGADIVVSDNGAGIGADKLSLVLEPFGQVESAYARSHGGTGLGLPIVRALTELHGGRFTLESRVGEGTIARVHLPSERLRLLLARQQQEPAPRLPTLALSP